MKNNRIIKRGSYKCLVTLFYLLFIISPPLVNAYHWWNDPGTGPAAGTFVFSHWPAMPITYIIDNETLPAGVTFAGSVAPAFNTWQNVPTSFVTFQQNTNNTGITNFTWNKCAANPAAVSPDWGINNDGRNEIGWVHNADLGFGTYGRGITTVNTDTGEIVDFTLLVNVDNSSGTDPTFQGVLTHELGHVLGIGHTAIGHPGFGFFSLPQANRPTMFPYAQSGDGNRLESLELDDILIVSRIYPETVDSPPNQVPFSLTQQKISGRVLKGTDGTFARGVYVRFINTANNNIQAAVLSDFFGESTGKWDIPGLPTGSWYLVINEISGVIYPGWIETDGVGSSAHTYTGFPEEHYDAAESNHDTATDKVALPVWSTWNTGNVNMVTNEGTLPDLSITPWGVAQAPPAPPWYKSPDIWVNNDGDAIFNEANEPERGNPSNQLTARIKNKGNASASGYQVSFSFRPYTTNAAAPFTAIQTAPETGSLTNGATREYTVTWDLSDTFIQANFPAAFWSADHFCVKAEIESSTASPLSDSNPYNNSTQHNYANVPSAPTPGGLSRANFFMYNHLNEDAMATLTWVARQKGWDVRFEGIENIRGIKMKAKEWIEVTAVLIPKPGAPAIKEGEPVHVDISQGLNGEHVGGVTIALLAPESQQSWKPLGISFHLGSSIPTGNLNQLYNPGLSLGWNLDYHFTSQISLVGYLGYNRFNSGLPGIDDTYWWNISANLKYEFNTNPLRPYINGGAGIYLPKNGKVKPGVNFGLGWDFSINANWIVELGGDYHHIFTGGTGTSFFTAHIGLIFRL
jgi:hypothetical protein